MGRWLYVIITLFLLLVYQPVSNTIGIIEGSFFPVASPLTVTDINEGSDRLLLGGSSPKHRPDCTYRSVEWKYGTPRNNVPIQGDFYDPPATNNVDFISWDGIWVKVPITLLGDTISYSWHQCPGRWWRTRTLWFEGDIEDSAYPQISLSKE
jgi:hypothetical protein